MSSDLRKLVLQYAQSHKHKQVGRGECWDLAHYALTDAKAKSAPDYGTVTSTSDDRWGKLVTLETALPGDVLQFKDHKATVKRSRKVKYTFPDKSWFTTEESEFHDYVRAHHTAILETAVRSGQIGVLEQNVKRGRGVLEKTVDVGTVYVSTSKPPTRRTTEKVLISAAWAQKVKAVLSPANRSQVDQILKKYNGKQVPAEVETTESTTVSGSIKAYSPEPRKKP